MKLTKFPYYVACFIGFLILWLNASTAWGDNRTLLRVGYLSHTLALLEGYGRFLKDRYSIDAITMQGSMVAAVRFMGDIGIGFEVDLLRYDTDYKTLNNTTENISLSMRQTLLTLHYNQKDIVEWAVGFGSSELTRTLPGYTDPIIVASNVANNEGSARIETSGTVAMLQVSYLLVGDTLGIEVALRGSQSIHEIPADDPRPALDERGIPEESDFNVGGVAGALMITLTF